MRAYNTNSIAYVPESTPDDDKLLRSHISNEFRKIQMAITSLAAGHLDITHVAPTKPREGDLRFADGTNWNPGSGQGIYAYYGAAWVKL